MKSKKILIVEDNDLNRKLFENLIGQLYSYETAKNGVEAIQKTEEQKFDLILMDIQMPQMDGITAMKRIKMTSLDSCPILAVTAFAEESERNNFLDQGFDDFILKPIRPREFLQTIQSFLQPVIVHEETVEPEIQDVILDKKILNQLFKYNSKDTIRGVFEEFLNDCRILEEHLKELPIQRDQLFELIHTLKGNSGTLGIQRIYLTAQKMEEYLKNEEMGNWERFKSKLKLDIKELRDFLNQETIFEP